ncbi:MAG: acetolactate synthase-1/2/3 large subunit [Chloroflexi bacterium]|jgi:acetolactate synthase-1/2/3 large subunit|nr:MAG: acetolactate synthase-1/2/3 large subunit [Chloroflexota bacterium]
MPNDPSNIAALIARFLKERGVERIFGLCGGHIQPIWDAAARIGIPIIDVRDERAAVHMAQAHSDLTGQTGVAMVTAGPGLTNAITGIANAHVARTPVLIISGVPPRPQESKGALQELPQADIVRPITRYARTVRSAQDVLPALAEAMAAAEGYTSDPGPAYIDFPTDLLREATNSEHINEGHFQGEPPIEQAIDTAAIRRAADLLWSARRPVVISGRGARGAGAEMSQILEALGALYLDTSESRGVLPDDHPASVPAMRGAAMRDADLVLTIGRKLDFQLGYGSAAVFPNARFVRLGQHDSEVRGNRPADVELQGPVKAALRAILADGQARFPATDAEWVEKLKAENTERRERLRQTMRDAESGSDGLMHPLRLMGAIQDALAPDAIVIADGGDTLSFARIGLSGEKYLDPGALGCLGVGVPFGIAASLAYPDRQVVVVSGDGSFGFNAIELDTCMRHGARPVFIVVNNSGWNIERYDQIVTYDGNIVGSELPGSDYTRLAMAFGMHSERVADPAELPAALQRAFEHAPALLDVLVTRDAPSPDARSGLAWVPDTQPLSTWDEAEKRLAGDQDG